MKSNKYYSLLTKSMITVLAFSSISAQAAIALDRTRIIFDGGQESISLTINNQNKQLPYLAQGWLEDENGNKISSPLVVLPPLQRLEPGKQSQVKVQSLPVINQLPQDRETLYYFNLREIPPKSSKPNTLQIALQTRIKLFYRPAAIKMDKNKPEPQQQLTLEKKGNNYVVNNPTGYYVTIIEALNSDGSNIKNFEPVMVAPKSKKPLGATIKGNPAITYINDFGGHPTLNFECSTSVCTVVQDSN
ncbi:MAG TPA: molecular chaperone [Providencia sp.]|uniref:fimbria/pilus periplasmic chaperone n=1 Tax=unclassified Providencia TaxID=2633465 RepID=UPI000EEE8144|nr:fimbria/pilus periplasmic chaperone [Providencia rettgeri]ELR5284667.1 fimbria/pilus periplasmic chaperone [Providencia rettgeri]ELY3855932.1 fimbria/pilus periplasmic chaperone [Providencia rettgeri]HCI96618.1 molecular chaperone [Providencia sp.]